MLYIKMARYLTLVILLMLSQAAKSQTRSSTTEESGEEEPLTPMVPSNDESIIDYEPFITETFEDWSRWSERYPLCTDLHFRSPMAIAKKDVEVDNKMKAIFVHSRLPVDDCLFLSVLYTEDTLKMEAVTISSLPECAKRLTYISGGGRQPLNLRYFKRAVFFFTNSEEVIPQERSLHQLFGRKFQMEILLEFVAVNEKDYTQVYILVDVQPNGKTPENPVFKALEASFQKLTEEVNKELDGKSNETLKLQPLADKCEKSKENLEKAEAEVKAITEGGSIKRVKALLDNIKWIKNKDFEKLEKRIKLYSTAENGNGAKNVTNSMEKTEVNGFENRTDANQAKGLETPGGNFLQTTEANKESTEEDRMTKKLMEMHHLQHKLQNAMKKETQDWAFQKLRSLLVKVDFVINDIHNQQNVTYNLEKLKMLKDLLKLYKIGVPGENKTGLEIYESPDAVHKDLEDMQRKVKEFEDMKIHHKETCEAFNLFKQHRSFKVALQDPFRISWLFPETGGYFLYHGTNPFPGCEPRDKTIVFETPLNITIDQLKLFQNLPSLVHKHVDGSSRGRVGKVVPVLSPLARTVWHVEKHAMFVNDDGFHERSDLVKQDISSSLHGSPPWIHVLFVAFTLII